MTDKITLSSVGNLQDTPTAATTINQNFTIVQEAFDNTLSRDGTQPNVMGASIDMNANQILNLPAPSTVNSPARLVDVTVNPTITVPPVGTSGATVPLLNGNNTWSGTNTFGAVTDSSLTVSGATTLTGPVTFGSTITFPGSITNSELATMPAGTLKGNNTGSTATPVDLTAAQVSTMIQPTLAGLYPSLSGVNTWTGNQYFKTGAPWADVKAFGAVGDSTTDDTTSLQNTINYMNTTFGGGTVFLPPGIYKTTGITVKGKVRIVGCGRDISYISGFVSNTNTVTFDSSCTRGCSLEDLTVYGYYNPNVALVSGNAIVISQNIPVFLKSITAWYGNAGLFTQGIDGHYFDCWFNGCQDCVVSTGANWYNRVVMDSNGSFASQRYSFWQGLGFTGADSQENSFVMCDLSGNFTKSVYLLDSFSATYVVSKFTSCVFSAPIDIENAYFTSFNGCEFGSTSFTVNGSTGGAVSVSNSCGFGVTVATPSLVQKVCNFNIT